MLPFPSLFCQILLFSDVTSNSVQLLQKLSITAVGWGNGCGKIEKIYVEDCLSISAYPMSAAYCISMITNAVEHKWKIL
ncbi:hypothetical protein R3W88_017702 [Solanum pinnatisectum]|uniref:Uncharacterized protein n=1 Tax=Solanum pinnatisectum TaxID=50273 RepID=A0AAV9L1D4_9SOLN|nr:hypothetical protein R3W88_017702 [Solanum pinnatisectum]